MTHSSDVWSLWLERAKPLIPVMVIQDLSDAIPLAQALVAGGVRILEVTLRSQAGLDAIRLIKQNVPDVIVGAGTVTNAEQFEKALEQGAQFIVSPGISPELLQAATAWGGPYLPGVATASEVMQARQAGFRFQKLFPAEAIGGSALLNALKGPFADVRFCPTGGINPSNYRDYLSQTNVFAVGGSWLTPAELITAKNWQAITALAIAI